MLIYGQANLQNTDLSEANLQKANVKYAKNLKVEQLLEGKNFIRGRTT